MVADYRVFVRLAYCFPCFFAMNTHSQTGVFGYRPQATQPLHRPQCGSEATAKSKGMPVIRKDHRIPRCRPGYQNLPSRRYLGRNESPQSQDDRALPIGAS
jgi:hypothetical protein